MSDIVRCECGASFDPVTQMFTEPHADYCQQRERKHGYSVRVGGSAPRGAKQDKADMFAEVWPPGWAVYQREYRFHPKRRWRFDFAWPLAMIAVEVDGNAWHVRGGGRHGKDSDREKINAAALAGWRVFHFSPQMLSRDPHGCAEMVRDAIADVLGF